MRFETLTIGRGRIVDRSPGSDDAPFNGRLANGSGSGLGTIIGWDRT